MFYCAKINSVTKYSYVDKCNECFFIYYAAYLKSQLLTLKECYPPLQRRLSAAPSRTLR